MTLLKNVLIKEIINNYNMLFCKKKNVIGMALGNKIINGEDTGETSIHILVKEKVPLDSLSSEDRIPKNFLSVKTDIIETGEFSFSGDITQNLKARIRPICPGCSISTTMGNMSGTIGAIVYDNKNTNKKYILSTSHILSQLNSLDYGSEIFQPAIVDSGLDKDNVIASLAKFALLNFNSGPSESKINYVDCAIAEINSKIEVDPVIPGIGLIKGATLPQINANVQKVGNDSQLTNGTITSINANISIEFEPGNFCTFNNQILTSKMSNLGDSGSLLCDLSNNAVGLIFAQSDTLTIASPIEEVLNYMDVHF